MVFGFPAIVQRAAWVKDSFDTFHLPVRDKRLPTCTRPWERVLRVLKERRPCMHFTHMQSAGHWRPAVSNKYQDCTVSGNGKDSTENFKQILCRCIYLRPAYLPKSTTNGDEEDIEQLNKPTTHPQLSCPARLQLMTTRLTGGIQSKHKSTEHEIPGLKYV